MSKLPSPAAQIDDILKCRSIEQVWTLHIRNMASYGFDRMIYASNRFRTGAQFGDPDDALLLINHDQDYINEFIGKGLFFDAPMSNWAAQNTGVRSWQWAEDRRAAGLTTPGEDRVMDFNHRMGVVAGYGISFDDVSGRAIAGIGLCAKRGLSQTEVDHLWQDKGDEIFLLNNVIHLKIASLPYERRGKHLTARQKEVLQWVADGKTTLDIAQIMGLNTATIEKHLRLARESLNVETTAQAILKASVQNQFFLLEDFPGKKVGKSIPLNA